MMSYGDFKRDFNFTKLNFENLSIFNCYGLGSITGPPIITQNYSDYTSTSPEPSQEYSSTTPALPKDYDSTTQIAFQEYPETIPEPTQDPVKTSMGPP